MRQLSSSCTASQICGVEACKGSDPTCKARLVYVARIPWYTNCSYVDVFIILLLVEPTVC